MPLKGCGSNRLTPHGYRDRIIFSSAKRCNTLFVKLTFSCSSKQVYSLSTHAPSSMPARQTKRSKREECRKYKPNLSNKASKVASCRDDLALTLPFNTFSTLYHAASSMPPYTKAATYHSDTKFISPRCTLTASLPIRLAVYLAAVSESW